MDLSNCVVDVSSRCDLSLAARDTVEPAVEKSQEELHDLHVCVIFNPSDRKSDTTGSTTGAESQNSPTPNWSRDLAFSRCAVFFFFSRVALCTVSYRVPRVSLAH